MQGNIERIEQLSEELKLLLPLKPADAERLRKKYRLEFHYNSNHIEGNTLTYKETELLFLHDQTTGNHELREYEEMKASEVALNLTEELAADFERPISETFIRELNRILLVRPFYKEAITADGQPTQKLIQPGQYKSSPNSVRLAGGEIFHYASVEDTPIQMGELMDWYAGAEKKKTLHPIELAAEMHYRFVRIHPFDDGNGRISRLLMNYVLLKHGFPPVIIKSADKQNYLRVLRMADVGDLQPFKNYLAEQLQWSLEISLRAAKGESIDEPGDLDKELALLDRELEGMPDQVKGKKDEKTMEWLLTDVLSQVIKISLQPFDELGKKFLRSELEISVQMPNQLQRKNTKIDLGDFPSQAKFSSVTLEKYAEVLSKSETPLDITLSLFNFKKLIANSFKVLVAIKLIPGQLEYYIKNSVSGIGQDIVTIKKPYYEMPSEKELKDLGEKMARIAIAEIRKNASLPNGFS